MLQRIGTILWLVPLSLAVAVGQQPASQPAGQQPPVTFKVEVNYVEVDAVVTDEAGNFAHGLTRADFQVFEDGKPQEIKEFALVNIPVERLEAPLYSGKPIEPDVKTNREGIDGRVYVFVLDDLHTAPQRSSLVRRAARQFIESRLGANDLAAVLHVGGRVEAGQEFTNNRRLLLEAVDKFVGRKLRSSTLERLDEYYRTRDLPVSQEEERRRRINDPLDAERGFHAQNSLRTLKSLAEVMTGVRGRRKSVVLFTEGIDYDIYDVFNNRSATDIVDEARRAIAAATRANVSFYAVDPRGLTSLGDEVIEMGAPPEDPGLGLGPTAFQSELQRSQDSLRVLADETGGFAVLNTNDFKAGFERIVRDNSSYYVLGYYPTNSRRDGRFRKIEVRVANPRLQVRARKGYVAPTGKPSPTISAEAKEGTSPILREVLNSPLPQGGLTLTAFAAPFKGSVPNSLVTVAVLIDGKDLSFKEKEGRFENTIELSMIALDQQGKMRGGERHTVKMELKPETRARVTQAGFRLMSHLEIPPGRYQLRVAARETLGGRVGSVHYDLEVPDFAKAPLVMSGLAITSAAATLVPTADPRAELNQLPITPTTDREFQVGDTLTVFGEVYDNTELRTSAIVDVTTQLRADDGRVVFQSREERSTTELSGGRGGYVHTASIPLKETVPGLYVLRLEARHRAKGHTVVREVQLKVRA